ncbi:aspartate kinase [Hydrogenimonas thermophila]|uniref:Aspartokinase n=1 Tax=Hydrogenimonas thermophila TaxID=223786 RepID=A0A1I5UQ91_9BACT|nr:aspartate kinase [Hydrogenimonas thermophila]SFP97399.1 aspartate kinase [Hydrogenimonas thermophila]
MRRKIVCKFGGSSVENAIQIKKVKEIIKDNKNRKYIVVSAPGRDEKYNEKITDHLINIALKGQHLSKKRISTNDSKEAVIKKFSTLCNDLDISKEKIIPFLENDFKTTLKEKKKIAFLASRGEHYNAKIIAEYFNKSGINTQLVLPEDIGFILNDDYLDAKIIDKTYTNLEKLKTEDKICIMPGFYGVTQNGDVAILSRGGSDLTGGELAYSINASLYENWSDIDGVYEVDPRIIKDADVIPRLTFKEIRLLSTKGFNVFHFDAMINCKKRNIPINIRNTNRPSASGTIILNERVHTEDVVGIAKLDNMAYIYLEKDGLGEEIGFMEGLLSIFNKYQINTYFYPTDKDDIAVLLKKEDLTGNINNLRAEIEEKLSPDVIDVVYDLAILSMVGIGLKYNSYAIADAVTVLKDNNIDIEMLDQAPAKLSFHIGIAQHHADTALKLLYNKLILND